MKRITRKSLIEFKAPFINKINEKSTRLINSHFDHSLSFLYDLRLELVKNLYCCFKQNRNADFPR
jgi:hypothetical protein